MHKIPDGTIAIYGRMVVVFLIILLDIIYYGPEGLKILRASTTKLPIFNLI